MVDGLELSADYALITFSLGVLQHDDVTFEPGLPLWKREAIQSMDMVWTFTPPKIPVDFHFPRREYIQKSSSSSRTSSGLIPRCGSSVFIVSQYHDVRSSVRSLCTQTLNEANILSGKASIMRTSFPVRACYLRL